MLKGTVAAIALATAAAFAAPAIAGKQDDTLRVAMAEEILNLDYLYTTKREYIILAQLTDATLFDIDPETAEAKPSVATDYEFVDETTLDITIRDDVMFHDGTELTPEDVAYTFNWVASAESEANATGVVERWLDNAEVTGPNTIRFHLKSVYPLVLRDMGARIPLRKAGTYDEGGEIDRDAMAQNVVGAGPYKVVSFEPGQELVLERFEGYFGKAPAIENIVVRNLPDIGTQQAELMSGGVDWMFTVPLDLAQSLGATPMAEHLAGPDLRVAFVVLDAAGYTDEDGPLTKLPVRQAINHALNKSEMAEYLIGGSAEPINTACHPAQFGCDTSVQDYPYDPERAKELLAEAGYPDGFPLELWAYREKPVAEAVASDLTAIGIDVNLRYVKLESPEPGPRQPGHRRLYRHLGLGRHRRHRGHRADPLRRQRPQPLGRRRPAGDGAGRRADRRPGRARRDLHRSADPDRRSGLLGAALHLFGELSRVAGSGLPARPRRSAAAAERLLEVIPAAGGARLRRPRAGGDPC